MDDRVAASSLDRLRVDQIGSLVPPPSLREAQASFAAGRISAQELRRLQDIEVRAVLRRQEAMGFPILTDGEFRRRNFQDSFGDAVTGYDTPERPEQANDWRESANPNARTEQKFEAAGPAVATRRAAVARLKLKRNVILEEYEAALACDPNGPLKVSLIGPDRIAQRFAWEQSQGVYKGLDDFIADVVAIQREMIAGLVAAGCRYIHIDAPGFTAYGDRVSLERMRSRGEEPKRNLERAIEAENAIIEGFPGVTFGLHLCSGNSRSVDPKAGEIIPQWHRESRYDDYAERLFSQVKHQRLLLEYDSERAGTFEPLRAMRDGAVAVLGLVTTKSNEVESVDTITRRVEAAAKIVPLDRLAISPQCGFSSDIGLAPVREDAQWRKLEALMQAASRIWGD